MASVDFDREARQVRAIRTLRESGNSVVLSFPPTVLQSIGAGVGDEIEIVGDIDSGEITLRVSARENETRN